MVDRRWAIRARWVSGSTGTYTSRQDAPADIANQRIADFSSRDQQPKSRTDSDTPPVLHPVFTLPAGHRWERVPGVTLLGDAAHLRAPNGEGANLAMQDGAELGRALAAHPGDAETALAEYERGMFARAAAVEADDDGFYSIMIDDDAPHSLLALMTGVPQGR